MSIERVAERIGVELDTTLTVSGKAADAKAVGDKIEAVSEAAVEAANESLAKKLDKVTKTGSTLFYGVNTQGEQYMHGGAINAVASTVALRGSNGTLNVGTPTLDTHAVTKKYVDDNATAVYRATYDYYLNTLNDDFTNLANAFNSGKLVMLTTATPVGVVYSFCCDGYDPYGIENGKECLVFHSCSTENIKTICVCADGTIEEKNVEIGDIGSALDSINDSLDHIIEIQNSLIGGE
jgi:hypothetical protein